MLDYLTPLLGSCWLANTAVPLSNSCAYNENVWPTLNNLPCFGVGSHPFEGEAYLPTCEDALLASSAWTRWREGTATWLRRQGSFCSETAAQDRKMVFLKVVLVGLASPRGLTVQCFPQEQSVLSYPTVMLC